MRLSLVLSTSFLGEYFASYYATAYSLALTGSATGLMLFAPLSQYLINAYGWRGSVLILGAVSSHIMLCGSLMRKNRQKESVESNKHSKCHNTSGNIGMTVDEKSTLLQIKPRAETSLAEMDTFGLVLFTNPRFIVLLIAIFTDLYQWTGWVIYLVPRAQAYGILEYKATSLATAGGVGNLVGKISVPILIDQKLAQSKTVLFIGLVLSGISLVVDSFLTNYYIFLVANAVLFGATTGASILCIFVLVKEVVGPGKLHKAMPWVFVVSGTGRLLAGFLVGK